MCMIAINVNDKRKKSLFSDKEIDFIKEANVQNPDGFGYYAWNKKTSSAEIGKFYQKMDGSKLGEILNEFNKNRNNYAFVITHSRFATSGDKGLSQVHPIPIIYPDKSGKNVYAGWYIIHNGVLENCGELISDTQLYGYEFGQWMHNHNIKEMKDITECETYMNFLENSMFKGSRVVIAHKDKYVVFNRSTGYEQGKFGDWHSGQNIPQTYAGASYYGGYDYWTSDSVLDTYERYDIDPNSQELCSVWNKGTADEYAYVWDLRKNRSVKIFPKHPAVEVNELDYDPAHKDGGK